MTSRYDQAKAIFAGAVDIVLPQKRQAYLAALCGTDEALRAEVEELLKHHQELGAFLEGSPLDLTALGDAPSAAEEAGTVVGGRYLLGKQIGAGGMGLVFEAEQQQPVRRRVALKIIKPGMDTSQVIARFEAEQQALALMDHPHIARVLDAGATVDGLPYFVMELVSGVALTQFCDEHRFTVHQRLELFIHVCEAVQHAHQKGIIHRDIKPSNVLVASTDGRALVKVIDFGIAKAMGQQLTDNPVVTQAAQLIGTPLYMAPEQFNRGGVDVDTRADVYALGVLLYELLTGTTPFDGTRFKGVSYDEICRILREEEPPRPSTRISKLSQAADHLQSAPRALTRQFRGELDWIIMKCLEKDRERRYQSANGLAEDIRRFLRDEPIQARPPSAWYRCRKFARRHQARLAFTGLVLFFLALLSGGLGWVALDRAMRQETQARAADESLTQAESFLEQGNWSEAAAWARRAKVVLNDSDGPAAATHRLQSVLADLDMVARLEEIRVRQAKVLDKMFDFDLDFRALDAEFAQAFHAYGIEIEKLQAQEAAVAIQSRHIRQDLILALDHWMEVRRQIQPRGPDWSLLRHVALAADDDELRKQLRTLQDQQPIDRQALEGLVPVKQIASMPATTLLLLGKALNQAGARDKALVVLQHAQNRHPHDFWTNLELGLGLSRMARWTDSIPFLMTAQALRPDNHSVRHGLAVAIFKKGDYQGALEVCEEVLRLRPQYALAWNSRGVVHEYLGQLDKAVADYSQALQLQPTYTAAWNNRGMALRTLGQLDKALADHDKVIQLNPDYASAYNARGVILASRGQHDKALPEFSHSIRLEPLNSLFWLNRGRSHGVLKQDDKALADCARVVQLKPADAEGWHERGLVYGRLGKHTLALEDHAKAIQLKSDFAAAWYSRGNAHALMGHYDKAVADFSRVIALQADHAKAWGGRGAAYFQMNKLEQARADCSKEIELDPTSELAWNMRGLVFAKLNQHDKALADHNQALKIKPDFHLGWHHRGAANFHLGRFDQALGDFSKTIELEPSFAEAWLNRGSVYLKLAQKDKALTDFTKALELKPDSAAAWKYRANTHALLHQDQLALKDYNKAIELDPTLAGAWSGRGCIHGKLGQAEKAQADFAKALELDPGSAETWADRGKFHRSLGQLDKGLADFSKALQINDAKAEFWVERGDIHRALGRLDLALADFSKALDLNPTIAAVWSDRGVVHRMVGQFDKALADLSKAIALQPDDPVCWNNRGNVHLDFNQPDKALGDFTKVLELRPDHFKAWNNRGNAHFRLKQLDKAHADYARAIELKADFAEAWIGRGLVHAQWGQFDQSLADNARALEIDPKSPYAWNNRGNVYARLGQWDKAAADFTRAVELKPDYLNAWNNRLKAHEKLGQWDKVVVVYDKFLDFQPKNPLIWTARGEAHFALGHWQKARADYTAAIELNAGFAQAHNDLAWLLANCPDLALRDPPRALEAAKKAVALNPKEGNYWNSLGVAHFRAGDWQAALLALDKSILFRKGGDAHDFFFLAMSHLQLGNKEQAQKWHNQGVEWMEKHRPQDAELRRFRTEADMLFASKTKKDPGPNPK